MSAIVLPTSQPTRSASDTALSARRRHSIATATESMEKIENRARPASEPTASARCRSMHIVGYGRNAENVCLYNIDVANPREQSRFTIRRRFSDFKSLIKTLRENALDSPTDLPSLPAHGLLWQLSSMLASEVLLQRRMSDLQELLDTICSSEQMQNHPAVEKFIGAAPESESNGYVSLDRYAPGSLPLTDQVLLAQMRKRALSETFVNA